MRIVEDDEGYGKKGEKPLRIERKTKTQPPVPEVLKEAGDSSDPICGGHKGVGGCKAVNRTDGESGALRSSVVPGTERGSVPNRVLRCELFTTEKTTHPRPYCLQP